MTSRYLFAVLIVLMHGCATYRPASVENGGCGPLNVKVGDTAIMGDGTMGVVVKVNGQKVGCPENFPLGVELAKQK